MAMRRGRGGVPVYDPMLMQMLQDEGDVLQQQQPLHPADVRLEVFRQWGCGLFVGFHQHHDLREVSKCWGQGTGGKGGIPWVPQTDTRSDNPLQ